MNDLEAYRYSGPDVVKIGNAIANKEPKPETQTLFIKGPLPLDWLSKASKIPRRNAILVGLMLFHLAGLRKCKHGLVLSAKRCEVFGLGRKAVQRGLRDLERIGLIRMVRAKGRAPLVDILNG